MKVIVVKWVAETNSWTAFGPWDGSAEAAAWKEANEKAPGTMYIVPLQDPTGT